MASRVLQSRARRLRRNMTEAERALWAKMRRRQILGFLFHRQFPMRRYILDFVCFERPLVIELDGAHHLERREYDAERTAWLESQGFEVLRFWNRDVLLHRDNVIEIITLFLQRRDD
jgi:very-short-patch-repair endonuclease